MARVRLDELLVRQGHFETAEQAQKLIRAGRVRLGDAPQTKPGERYAEDSEFTVKDAARWVSRGGGKLQGAFDTWPELSVAGLHCIDIGSSTGGFTDCLLQAGAAHVTAVDVGKGLLAWSLRNDERVTVLEQTNARHLESLPSTEAHGAPQFFCSDVSFISLTKILPAIGKVCAPDAFGVTLIKPQFEARREQVGKGGVVRDAAVHREVCERVKDFAESELGWRSVAIIASPLTGPKGNREFLARWQLPS